MAQVLEVLKDLIWLLPEWRIPVEALLLPVLIGLHFLFDWWLTR